MNELEITLAQLQSLFNAEIETLLKYVRHNNIERVFLPIDKLKSLAGAIKTVEIELAKGVELAERPELSLVEPDDDVFVPNQWDR